jgi:ABC-type hemin transport system substrate-binding protein
MENNYKGVIIEESLGNKIILKDIRILSTKIEEVTEEHKTPWIKKWTLHTVEILEDKAEIIAKQIGQALDTKHAWYADFKNNTHHYIIFRDKIFFIDRRSKEQYNEAKEYGISLGIPEYQVDFHPEIKGWER